MKKRFRAVSKSPRTFWKLGLALGCLTALSLVVVACSSGSGASSASGMGTVTVTVSDPATCQAPNGPYAAVWVTITEVDVNMSSTATSSSSGWTDYKLPTPKQVNLLGTPQTGCFLATLGDNLELQAGTYQQIRLKLAPNSGTVYGSNCNGANNCVVLSDNSVHTLNLSSEAQTGIKIPAANIASGGFTVGAGKTEDLDINFLTCDSIIKEGNGQYRLLPVLRAGEVNTTSNSINGTVLDASGSPINGIVTVTLEQKDTSGIDREVMSQTADSNGTWVICPVTMGNTSDPYDIVITAENSAGTMMYAPAIITGVSVGDTTGTVKLQPGTTNSVVTLNGAVNSVNSSNTGVSIDVLSSVLEQVNSTWYTIPVTLEPASNPAQVLSQNPLTTAQTPSSPTLTNPACNPLTAYCASYSYGVPSSGAYYGAWSTTGTSLTAPTAATPTTYKVDGIVTGGTCTQSELMTPAVNSPFSTTLPTIMQTLSFAGCTAPAS